MKRKIRRFDEGGGAGGDSGGGDPGGDARAGMGFAGTGSGLAGSGASDAAAGRGDSDGNGGESGIGRNTGDASRSGGSREAGIARAGDGFAGTGSGLGGTGAEYARKGIGGDGPSLGERQGDYVSAAQFNKITEKNNQAKSDAASLALGLNNEDKKYVLSNKEDAGGDVTTNVFKNYTDPYSAQNEFNFQLKKAEKKYNTVYKKGGAISLKDCKVSTHKPNKKNSNW
jgi:hypothetical protein